MKVVDLLKLLLEAVTYYLKKAAETTAEAALKTALNEERKAQARLVKAILKYDEPNDYQRAYVDALHRELRIYEKIREASFRRFECCTKDRTGESIH
tara:strand:+ start:1561 stop:1851 length:291 start_codon:yes stop_codon:yes gene_type:complete